MVEWTIIEDEKNRVRKYARWFWLGIWSSVIMMVLGFAVAGVGVMVYGTSFLLLGRTRLAIGATVVITLIFLVFSLIAQGWGEDWTQRRVGPPE